MATRTGAVAPLSTADLDGIREGLAAGRKPKVMFTAAAGQIAGEVGQVVQLTDPADSDEWVVVRFGRDELPFSPADLTMPPKGRPAKAAEPRPPAPRGPGPAGSDASNGANGSGAPAADGATPPAGSTEPAEPARPTKRAAKAARASKPKAPPALTVTLAYDSGEWTIAAQQGNKTLAKPYVVRAAEAQKMVEMVDVPGVHEAVEAIVAAEVAEAAQRAEQLRNELAEVEARLADLRGAG